MRCPFCGNPDTSVKDSRNVDENATIRRRRFCEGCGSRFTTFERVQLRELYVLKRSGQRVPFDRDKLAKSIMTAMHKRALDPERVERVITAIVRQLETLGESEVTTKLIGEMVMDALYNLDTVAYVRFASIYKDFTSVQDFMDFISPMEAEHKSQ
jgi:transcriptional repressor NrdR